MHRNLLEKYARNQQNKLRLFNLLSGSPSEYNILHSHFWVACGDEKMSWLQSIKPKSSKIRPPKKLIFDSECCNQRNGFSAVLLV